MGTTVKHNTSSRQRFMKRLYGPKDFFRFLVDMLSSVGAMRKGRKEQMVSEEFSERIMLAVTEVNGCRYCSYFHTQVALKAGLNDDEVREALDGNFSQVPQDQLPALLYAQHYAETGGKPEAEMSQRLLDIYGADKAVAITGHIRAIMIGNAWGNAFDSLRVRLKGQPSGELNILQELSIIIGVVLMLPMAAVAALFRNTETQKSTDY